MTSSQLEGQKALLLDLLRYSYDTFAWHGPNLMQALRGLAVQQAAWRPADEAPVWNIHELTLHVADVMQRCSADLFGVPISREVNRSEFPLPNMPGEAEWVATLQLLQQSYASLEAGLRAMPASALIDISSTPGYGRTWTFRDQLHGIALHNTYHAAQIVSLRKRQRAWIELA
jgi:uncharacterized damage-inducible protein DinB